MLCSLVRGRGFLFFRKTAEVKQNNLNSFLMRIIFPERNVRGLVLLSITMLCSPLGRNFSATMPKAKISSSEFGRYFFSTLQPRFSSFTIAFDKSFSFTRTWSVLYAEMAKIEIFSSARA